MPIQYEVRPDGLYVTQSFDAPTVYLDHWAIMTFAEDRALQDRLVTDIRDKGGTLVLSTLSFGEFAAPVDPRHCRQAEEFIDRVMPRIFLTDQRLDEILAQERAQPDNRVRFPPSSDTRQLRLLVQRCLDAGRPLSIHGFIGLARDWAPQIVAQLADLTRQYRERFERARQDAVYRQRARDTLPDARRPRTMVIMGELMRGFALDQNAELTPNNCIDFLHALQVNSCDFVLLDRAWQNRVEEMRRRILQSDPQMEIARCYSCGNNGLERFLVDLEAVQSRVVR